MRTISQMIGTENVNFPRIDSGMGRRINRRSLSKQDDINSIHIQTSV